VYVQILNIFDRLGMKSPQSSRDDPFCTSSAFSADVEERVTRCILAGYFPNVSIIDVDNVSYVPVRPVASLSSSRASGTPLAAEVHPSSYLHQFIYPKREAPGGDGKRAAPPPPRDKPELVVFIQLRQTKKPYMVHVTEIRNAEWVLDASPTNYFQPAELSSALRKRKQR
jgi:hypothetical protein